MYPFKYYLFILSLILTPDKLLANILFYKTPYSLFPSGQASLTLLEKNLIQTQFEHLFLVQWNNKQILLPAKKIIRDIQVSKKAWTSQSILLLSKKNASANALELLATQSLVHILTVDSYWAEVLNPLTKKMGYVPLHLLLPAADDLGVAITVWPSLLRSGPSYNHPSVGSASSGLRFKIYQIKNNFAKVSVQIGSKIQWAYLDLNHTINKMDFVNQAWDGKNWHSILYRHNDDFINSKHQAISLHQTFQWKTNGALSYANESDVSGAQTRSKLEILSAQAHLWAQSRIDKHGKIWWKKQEQINSSLKDQLTSLLNKKINPEHKISTQDLLQRSVFSFAFEPQQYLVSANGVFYSENQKIWHPIQQFKNKNLPVAILPPQTLIVGNFKSQNSGKTFEPYIRWDQLTSRVQHHLGKEPKYLRLKNITALNSSQVELEIETGYKNLKLPYTVIY